MPGSRRVLEEISRTLAGIDGRLAGMDGRLGSMDGRLGSMDGKLGSMDGKLGSMDGRLATMERTANETLAAIHSLQDVNRQLLLELRSHRTILGRIDDGVQSNTKGLMHVLDELRGGRGGPGAAPAA